MAVILLEKYLENPCRASSIPYWKAKAISLPENMLLLHHDHFTPSFLENYTDEPYFRLYHDLNCTDEVTLPAGFSFGTGITAAFVGHINCCYPGAKMTEAALENYRSRTVYDPALWITIREDKTGQIIASGIGELDFEIGEGVLEWIQVSAEYRDRGLGQCIVKELLRRMKGKADFATVSGQCNNTSNPEALYRKCGFTGNDVWHVMYKRGK